MIQTQAVLQRLTVKIVIFDSDNCSGSFCFTLKNFKCTCSPKALVLNHDRILLI